MKADVLGSILRMQKGVLERIMTSSWSCCAQQAADHNSFKNYFYLENNYKTLCFVLLRIEMSPPTPHMLKFLPVPQNMTLFELVLLQM